MPNLENTSIICPRNDGESKTIINIAKKLKLDVRISAQGWGAELDKEPKNNLENLKKVIIIVEMPSEKLELNLKKKGHTIKIIDHHKYNKLDRTSQLSSLEQFAKLVNYKLDRFEKGIALNDRGYIYLLHEEGYSLDEIKKIREFDLKTQVKSQGLNFQKIKKISRDAKKSATKKNNILIVNLPIDYNMYLLDLVKMENPNKMQNLLTISKTKNKITLIQFFGEFNLVKKLHKSLGGFMGGNPKIEEFWGIKENINLKKVYEILDI